MDVELLFRLLIVGIYAVFAAIRIAYRLPASQREEGEQREPPRVAIVAMSFGIIGYFIILILYLIYVPLILWFTLPLPSIVRWIGVITAILCVPTLYWIHTTLDKQYSAQLEIQEDHNLIEIGPYRKVRHPMYTVFIVFLVGIALVTTNLLGFIFSLLISCSFPSVAKTEEAMLTETFGDEYRSYMERTGRFLPPLRSSS
ncbi:MAG: isoprenylcysteine carboxylmethyltransferase family protein [Candidatus Thorarchaeota archaeon]